MGEGQAIKTADAPAGHAEMANAIRALAMDAVQKAKSGHPGMPMGMADVATVLFRDFLRFDPNHPNWLNRDRFVLSAGHGSMLLYSLLHLTGYPDMTLEEIKNFRQLGSKTAGHPEYGHATGIETTTGPLGQGLANAVGMALSERLLNARVGSDLIDHHVYCLAGDGCLMEGISHEAISMAGHLKLGKLIVLFDDNSISIDGETDLAVSDDQQARFKASGWNTIAIDGHNPSEIANAIEKAKSDPSAPWLIACKSTIGHGAPTRAGTAKAHGEPLGPDEIAGARENLNWPHEPFEIPSHVREAWQTAGKRGAAEFEKWASHFEGANNTQRQLIANDLDVIKKDVDKVIKEAKQAFAADETKRATRVWSQKTLEHLVPVLPQLIGGSADLTGSNGTRTNHHTSISADDFAANYIHYGVREHAMAAVMNGLALSGSIIPYGGTFFVFTDYCRPSIRLSALMRQRVIYIMTHDSIGLGEDGPTHQPVEHFTAMRAIPNLNVMRPCDAIETAECWQIAIESEETPSILALTRQGVPTLRAPDDDNKCRKGGYVIRDAQGARDVTLIATGSEVGLAVEAADTLAQQKLNVAIVSLPSFELFREQPESYRSEVLGESPRVAIEAGLKQCWYEWLRPDDVFVGLDDFGASAPGGALFEYYGLTSDRIVTEATRLATKS